MMDAAMKSMCANTPNAAEVFFSFIYNILEEKESVRVELFQFLCYLILLV